MANTYTQLHIHAVFAVKYRSNLIGKEWKEELYKYIAGVIKNNGHKIISINGMPDHVFFGMRPVQSLSQLMQDVKGNSSKWINDQKFIKGKFEWQSGYGAFSYSKSHVHHVVSYINNQEAHHAKISFVEEYKELLSKFGIDYDDAYIFSKPY